MPIRFACAECGARVKTPDGSVGKKMKCPRCGHMQRVPEAGKQEQGGEAKNEPEVSVASPHPIEAGEPQVKDDLAALAAAGAEEVTTTQADATESSAGSQAPAVSSQEQEQVQEQPAAPARARPQPKPQAQASPDTSDKAGPRAIPISTRPRPLPQPNPERGDSSASPGAPSGGSALSAQVLSAPSAHAPSTRRPSIDINSGQLPRARSAKEVKQAAGMLNLIAWVCRVMALLIAAGGVELGLHAKRQGGSVVTMVILIIAGLAAAVVALAVAQVSAISRRQ